MLWKSPVWMFFGQFNKCLLAALAFAQVKKGQKSLSLKRTVALFVNSNTIYTQNISAKYALACKNSLCEYWSFDHSPTTNAGGFSPECVGGGWRTGDVLLLIQYSSMPQWPAGTTSYFENVVCEKAAYQSHCLCIIITLIIIIDVRTIRTAERVVPLEDPSAESSQPVTLLTDSNGSRLQKRTNL